MTGYGRPSKKWSNPTIPGFVETLQTFQIFTRKIPGCDRICQTLMLYKDPANGLWSEDHSDASIMDLSFIYINAGRKGLLGRMPLQDLTRIVEFPPVNVTI